MRAARVQTPGGSDQVRIEDLPVPSPGPGEVLVRVAAAGVNPIDWKIREGLFPHAVPYTPGQDLSGVVAVLGEGVDAFAVGDPVYGMLTSDGDGSYAEQVLAPVGALARSPAGLSLIDAAAIPMGALTAWIALLDRGDLRPGQRVLVHGGAGAVGSMAVQIAKARGAWVAATASRDGIKIVHDLGADLAIDYTAGLFEDEVASAGLVDLVLDTVAGATRDRSWRVIAPGGAMVSTLGSTSPPEEARARGVRGLPGFGATPDGTRLAEVAAMVEAGLLRPSVGATRPLDAAAEAMDLNQFGRIKGKVLIVMPDRPAWS